MIKYSDIDPRIKGFIFELDNVLFPEKEYLYQVYYLFAGYLEYTELLDAKVLVNLMYKHTSRKGPPGYLMFCRTALSWTKSTVLILSIYTLPRRCP